MAKKLGIFLPTFFLSTRYGKHFENTGKLMACFLAETGLLLFSFDACLLWFFIGFSLFLTSAPFHLVFKKWFYRKNHTDFQGISWNEVIITTVIINCMLDFFSHLLSSEFVLFSSHLLVAANIPHAFFHCWGPSTLLQVLI